MKTLLLFALSLVAWTLSHAQSWTIDEAHSTVTFEINHFLTAVPGGFNTVSGDLDFDPESPGESSISMTVDVNSVDTDNEKRDNHLLSEDFFHADEFPLMTFTSTSWKKRGRSDYIVTGELTIRGQTRTIEVPVVHHGIMDNPFKEGGLITGFRAEFTINRTDFGVGTGSWAATAVVGDKVHILVSIEAVR